MALYRLYYYKSFFVAITLDHLNPLIFYDYFKRLPLLCYLWLFRFLCCFLTSPYKFFVIVSLCFFLLRLCYAFTQVVYLLWFVFGLVWICYIVVSCAILLHKLSIGFSLLLAWCRLITLLSCVLRFYTSCLFLSYIWQVIFFASVITITWL